MSDIEFKRNARELKERKGVVKTVGLTGGIASGKSVATKALRAAGFYIVDADEISRTLTAPGTPAEKELTHLFPNAVKGGTLDRRTLRKIISEDEDERAKLNAFTHPLIIDEIKKAIALHGTPVIIAAPLLFETALSSLCDATVCVTAPRAVRIERLIERDGVTRSAAEAIIDAQIPDFFRATLADYCVPSDTDVETFTAETVDLFTRIFS